MVLNITYLLIMLSCVFFN